MLNGLLFLAVVEEYQENQSDRVDHDNLQIHGLKVFDCYKYFLEQKKILYHKEMTVEMDINCMKEIIGFPASETLKISGYSDFWCSNVVKRIG